MKHCATPAFSVRDHGFGSESTTGAHRYLSDISHLWPGCCRLPVQEHFISGRRGLECHQLNIATLQVDRFWHRCGAGIMDFQAANPVPQVGWLLALVLNPSLVFRQVYT
jgi:hypothetical protein